MPDRITVHLIGTDGNAYSIIGRVRASMIASGLPDDEIRQFTREAMSSCSYDELLACVMRWVDVE